MLTPVTADVTIYADTGSLIIIAIAVIIIVSAIIMWCHTTDMQFVVAVRTDKSGNGGIAICN